MQLIDLNDHVLGEILSHCDIYHVLRWAEVNRHCRRIALSKQLWISLIRDLEFRSLIDLDPEERLEGYDTPDLIEIAKRAARGPRTWSPASATPPTVLREVVLQFDTPHEPGAGIHLLPGGKYVVMWRSVGIFALWAIAPQRCIWMHPARLGTPALGQQAGYIEVSEVDLMTGDSQVQFQAPIPHTFRTAGPMNILGDVLTLGLSTKLTHEIRIVNWRADTCVPLKVPPSSLVCSSLVRGHLIVAYRDPSVDDGVVSGVYPLDSFHWSPLDQTRPWSDVRGIPLPKRAPSTIVLPFTHVDRITFLGMRTYQSPTRRDTYKVTIRLRIELPDKGLVRRLWNKVRSAEDDLCSLFLLAYMFTPSSTPSPELKLLRTIPQPRMFPHTVSGYGSDFAGRLFDELVVVDGWAERDGVRTLTVNKRKGKEESREVVHVQRCVPSSWSMLGQYSAAVPVLEERAVRILYFK